jgi:NAD(P)H-hydrate epimerase
VKVVSSETMAEIDRRSQAEFAFPSTLLMEDAGLKAWAMVRRLLAAPGAAPGRIVFVAGRGNNGGDALVMARQSAVEGIGTPTVLLAGGRPDAGTDPGRMLAMCEALGIPCVGWPVETDHARSVLSEADWIVDGIAGTGLRGALRPPLSELVPLLNEARGTRIAVDVPSGVRDGCRRGDPVVNAAFTLTMGLPKNCLYLPHARVSCGRILVVPVGFPRALVEDAALPGEMITRSTWKEKIQPIPADVHKNQRGHLAVFAGARGTTGAAWLCATAAARCRVGLVTLHAGSEAYPVLAPRLTSVMCRPWDSEAAVRAAPAWDPAPFSALLVGPGWGVNEANGQWLQRLLSLPLPGVIDADALTLLGGALEAGRATLGGRWVLTPHPGEFSRLSGVPRDEILDDPVAHARSFAARHDAVLVLKGHTTVVADPGGRYWILDGANPALATAGSGDVLAGIVAAGIAGGLAPLDAALFGVSLHSHIGRIAARRLGWFLAEDMVPLLSPALGK